MHVVALYAPSLVILTWAGALWTNIESAGAHLGVWLAVLAVAVVLHARGWKVRK